MKEVCIGMKVSIGLVWIAVVVCSLIVVLMTALNLPNLDNAADTDTDTDTFAGAFGAMMIAMLPRHVPFTVFVPSEDAFHRHLSLVLNRSDHTQLTRDSDAYALVSRVLGFSAVPRALSSGDVAAGQELWYDSISGYALCVCKDHRGMLVVNNRVRSTTVDLRTDQLIVHIIDGVLMDSEFHQSLQPDD